MSEVNARKVWQTPGKAAIDSFLPGVRVLGVLCHDSQHPLSHWHLSPAVRVPHRLAEDDGCVRKDVKPRETARVSYRSHPNPSSSCVDHQCPWPLQHHQERQTRSESTPE